MIMKYNIVMFDTEIRINFSVLLSRQLSPSQVLCCWVYDSKETLQYDYKNEEKKVFGKVESFIHVIFVRKRGHSPVPDTINYKNLEYWHKTFFSVFHQEIGTY